jgi:hypothetical protein
VRVNLWVKRAVSVMTGSLIGAIAWSLAAASHAESCGMNGCYVPGYIFLPDPNFELKRPIPNTLNGMPCASAEDAQTFAKPGLPLVNETVTIKARDKHIFFEPLDVNERAVFAPVEPHFAADKRSCSADWREPEGWRIEPGTRVRILGYRTFVGQRTRTGTDPKTGRPYTLKTPHQILFAFVLAINP